MIPFNYLGPVFKSFASLIYPKEFKKDLLSVSEQIDKGEYVLDAGSGTGILSQFLFAERKDLKYILIDPAPGMLKFAPGFAVKTIGKAESMPFADGCFAAVMIGDAFHHFNDPDRAARELRRVLRPSGILIIFEIDPAKAIGRFITTGEKIFGEPANFFSPRELSAKLEANGFECRISQYSWRYAILGKRHAL